MKKYQKSWKNVEKKIMGSNPIFKSYVRGKLRHSGLLLLFFFSLALYIVDCLLKVTFWHFVGRVSWINLSFVFISKVNISHPGYRFIHTSQQLFLTTSQWVCIVIILIMVQITIGLAVNLATIGFQWETLPKNEIGDKNN